MSDETQQQEAAFIAKYGKYWYDESYDIWIPVGRYSYPSLNHNTRILSSLSLDSIEQTNIEETEMCCERPNFNPSQYKKNYCTYNNKLKKWILD